MFEKLTDGTKAFLFYGIALALALAAALMPGASTSISMLTPLVAVLIMLFVVTRDGYTREGLKSLGLHRLGLRAWPVAILGPLLVMGLAYGVLWSLGVADFRVPDKPLGFDVSLWMLPLLLVALLVNVSLTTHLGEEIGWRGYLLPRLEYLGAWAAVLLSGLLHGVWHLPVILLTDLYHPGGNKLIVVPLFLLSVTLAGVFLGYLRLRTGSVWPAVLGHAAHNMFWALFAAFTASSSPLVSEYLAGESGVLVLLGYAALGGVLMYTLTRRPRPAKLRPAESV